MENTYFFNILNDNKLSFAFPNLDLSLEEAVKGLIPTGSKYLIIENYSFDKNNTVDFRFCYSGDFSKPNGSVSELFLDLEKAKLVVIEKMRKARKPLLESLDIDYTRATETADTVKIQEIVDKKNQLRNITNLDLSSATDLISLKALWPTDILGESPFNK